MAQGSSYYFVGQSLSTQGPTFVNPSFTGQMFGADGTAALPAYSFTADPDTGMYRIGANQIGFSIGGAQAFSIAGTSLATIMQIGSGGTPTNTRLYFGQQSGAVVYLRHIGDGVLSLNRADGAAPVFTSGFLGITSTLSGINGTNNIVLLNVLQTVVARTATATLSSLSNTGHASHNTGAGAETVFTLSNSSAPIGTTFTLVNNSAFGLKLQAVAGDVIQFPGSASTSGGTQTTTTIGGTVTVIKLATNLWGCVGGPGGTWVSA